MAVKKATKTVAKKVVKPDAAKKTKKKRVISMATIKKERLKRFSFAKKDDPLQTMKAPANKQALLGVIENLQKAKTQKPAEYDAIRKRLIRCSRPKVIREKKETAYLAFVKDNKDRIKDEVRKERKVKKDQQLTKEQSQQMFKLFTKKMQQAWREYKGVPIEQVAEPVVEEKKKRKTSPSPARNSKKAKQQEEVQGEQEQSPSRRGRKPAAEKKSPTQGTRSSPRTKK